MARIHAATAADPTVATDFPTDNIFYDIRLEPYLVATGRAHPDLQPRFAELVATTQANKRALVHGDVSPKNILNGPAGPVFLDAECAWWGDPAFDAAFCAEDCAVLAVCGAWDAAVLAWSARWAAACAKPEVIRSRKAGNSTSSVSLTLAQTASSVG